MCTRESLDCYRPLCGDHNAERLGEISAKQLVQRSEQHGQVKLCNHIENIDALPSLGKPMLASELPVKRFRSLGAVQNGLPSSHFLTPFLDRPLRNSANLA